MPPSASRRRLSRAAASSAAHQANVKHLAATASDDMQQNQIASEMRANVVEGLPGQRGSEKCGKEDCAVEFRSGRLSVRFVLPNDVGVQVCEDDLEETQTRDGNERVEEKEVRQQQQQQQNEFDSHRITCSLENMGSLLQVT